MDKKEIGRRLRELRGFRPARIVAEAAGVSVPAIYAYERGKVLPSPEVMRKMAAFFGESVDKIFFA